MSQVSRKNNFEEREIRAPDKMESSQSTSASTQAANGNQAALSAPKSAVQNGAHRVTPNKDGRKDDVGTSPPTRGFTRAQVYKEPWTPPQRGPQKTFKSLLNLSSHKNSDGGDHFLSEPMRTLDLSHLMRESFDMLHEFQQKGDMCDLELKLGSRSIKCHRVVLSCASRYFRIMFTTHMKESKSPSVELKELDYEAVEALIQFAYTWRITLTVDNVQPLLFAASFLQFEVVALACGDFMKQHMHPSNCIGMRKFAEQHGRTDLQELADSYMSDHFQDMVDCEEFNNITPQHLADVISSDNLNVDSEIQVYEAVMRWVKFDPNNRKQTLAPLLSKVKLPLLPPSYLTQVVEAEDLIRRDMECRDYLDEAKSYQLSLAGLTPQQQPYDRMVPRRSCSGVLFCVGGRGASGDPFRSIECFDFRNDRWFEIAEMSTRRRHVGVVSADGKLYAIGGHDGNDHLSSCEVFDPASNRWHSTAPMTTPRRGLAVAALGGALYAIGGLDDVTCFATVERFDPSANSWSIVAPMNVARGGVGVAVLKNCIYAVGGNDGKLSVNSCERYDPILNKWVVIAPMNKLRAGAGVAVLHGKLYAVGGFDDNSPLDSAEVYDADNNHWSYVTSMNFPRGGLGAAALGGYLFAVGGHDGANYLNSVEAYNPLSDCWTLHSTLLDCRSGSGICSGQFHIAEPARLQRLKSHYQSAGVL